MLERHGVPVRRRVRVVAPAQLEAGVADHDIDRGCGRAVGVQVQAPLLVHGARALVLVVVPRESDIDLRSRASAACLRC